MFSVELEQSEIEDIVYEDIGVAVEKKSLAPMWFDHKKKVIIRRVFLSPCDSTKEWFKIKDLIYDRL